MCKKFFKGFVSASLSQIFLTADQYLPYSCNEKNPVVDKASSQKLSAAFVYRIVFYILEVPLLLLNVKLFYLL